MAVLGICRCLCLECLALCYSLYYIGSPLCALPGDILGNDLAPSAVHVYRNSTDGICDYCQHVLLYLRSGLGFMGADIRMDDLDY